MIKNSIGELKLSPIKENGKFVFFNDFITINGKVSKGDRITLFVDSYEFTAGKYNLVNNKSVSGELIVRGIKQNYIAPDNFNSVNEAYDKAAEQYKENFYFGNKV